MNVRVEEVDLSDLSSSSNLLQSAVWANFKAGFGWNAHAYRPTAGPWSGETILVLLRRLAPGISLAYVPYGPAYPQTPSVSLATNLTELGAALAAALPVSPICVRFDLLWESGSLGEPRPDGGAVARRAPVDVQPPSTVLIDLTLTPDELLAAMHKKNRYNIRLAERKGVEVRAAGDDELDRWYDLYRETALRDQITIHPLRYYHRLFELARDSTRLSLQLYLAEHESDLLAGIIVAEFGDQATYLYGASSNLKRSLMEAGITSYDLFGVPPADDPAHPMHGLYRFKTGFGGRLVHRAGSWDVVIRPMRYNAYRFAERVRSFYFHRMRKTGAR